MKKNKIGGILTAIVILCAVGAGAFLLYRHFTTIPQTPADELRAQQEKENRINGQWQADENTVCDIYRDEYGIFHGMVTVTESDDTVTFFESSGNWRDEDNGFRYSDGKKTRNVYKADGSFTEKEVYTDAKGIFYLDDGKVYWDDKEEHAADGVPFTYVGEY